MVEYEEAAAYAEENGLLFMETSAKNANNVNEIFLAIARRLPRDQVSTLIPGVVNIRLSCVHSYSMTCELRECITNLLNIEGV